MWSRIKKILNPNRTEFEGQFLVCARGHLCVYEREGERGGGHVGVMERDAHVNTVGGEPQARGTLHEGAHLPVCLCTVQYIPWENILYTQLFSRNFLVYPQTSINFLCQFLLPYLFLNLNMPSYCSQNHKIAALFSILYQSHKIKRWFCIRQP